MAAERKIMHGIVRDGVIVLDKDVSLPEGAAVEISVIEPGRLTLPADMQAEFDAWDRASDEAWAMIDAWEREESPSGGAGK